MSTAAHTINANGQQYQIQTYGSQKALSYLSSLFEVFGSGLQDIIKSWSDDALDDESTILSVLMPLLCKVDVKTLTKLIPDMMAQNVFKLGQPIIFDQEFAENYGTMIVVLYHILRLNYTSFLKLEGFNG